MSSLLRSPFLDVTQRSPKVACVAGVERGSDIQKTAVRSRETTVCHAHEYFYGEKAPIYYQLYKRSTLSYINRKLVPILR